MRDFPERRFTSEKQLEKLPELYGLQEKSDPDNNNINERQGEQEEVTVGQT